MSYGYSVAVADIIRKQRQTYPNDPVYKLGELCIAHNIVPSEIAKSLGVSKQTIYKWFEGSYHPRRSALIKIEELIRTIRAQHK